MLRRMWATTKRLGFVGGSYTNDNWGLYGKDGAIGRDEDGGRYLLPGTDKVGNFTLEDALAPVPFVDLGVLNSTAGIGIGYVSTMES